VEMTDNLDPEWIALVNARKTLIEKMNGLKEEKATADESHAQDTKDMERVATVMEKIEAGFGTCLAPLKKKGQFCQNQGHPFCGRHKKMAEEVAHIVEDVAAMANIGKEEVFHVQEKREILEFLRDWHARVKDSSENSATKIQLKEREIKEAKEESVKLKSRGRKVKGVLESTMMQALKDELKVHPQELYGELTLVGNDCRKVVDNHDIILRCLEEYPDLYEKYRGLFNRLKVVVDMLFQVSPHFSIEVIESEAQLFQEDDEEEGTDTVDAMEEEEEEEVEEEEEEEEIEINIHVQQSAVQKFKELVVELGSYFHAQFVSTGEKKAPLPKSHFLVYHAPQFVERWLSLGMFSEQGCEALHSRFNVMKRKLINMGKEKAQEHTIKKHNLKYSVRWGSWKRKK